MAATLVQKRETLVDSGDSVSLAYSGNVTSGNLLTVEVARYAGGSAGDVFIDEDLTQTAGTATIGAVAIDAEEEESGTPGQAHYCGIFSAPCTGTGSLTWTVTGQAGEAWWVNISEWSGVATTKEGSNSGTGTTAAADSGNVTSAGAALFLGVITSSNNTNMTITQDAAFTLLNEEEDATAHHTGGSAYRRVASATTDSASWTLQNPPAISWAAALAVYAETGGGGSSATPSVATQTLTGIAPRMDLGIRPPTLLRG